MDDTHWAVSLVIAWLPMLLFAGCVVWHARQVRRCMTTQDGRSLAQALEDFAREAKRANDLRAMAGKQP
jgi:hypothetical protein